LPFGIAYLLHLLVDWLDVDEKRFLFPFNMKFRGFLQIWSRVEQAVTVLLLILLTLVLLSKMG